MSARTRQLSSALALTLAVGAACSETTPTTPGPADDAGSPRVDGGAGPSLQFERRVIDAEGAGFTPELARAPDGHLGVAWLRRAAEAGVCARVAGNPPILRWDVMYADEARDWAPERVATVEQLAPSGLALAFDADSRPAVAFLGGGEAVRRCGVGDLALARRGADGRWAAELLATDSAATPVFEEDRMQCAAAQNQCNVGDVVGEWPALAWIGGGPVIAFRDVHFGFTQDDWDRSDLELVQGGRRVSIDAGWGGGEWSRIVDFGGAPLVAHFNRNPTTPYGDGIWVVAADGADWTRSRVVQGTGFGYRLGLAALEDRVGLAVHDEADQKLLYFERRGAGDFEREVVDQRGNVGFSPSLRYGADGRAWIAYRSCGRYDPRNPACAPDADSLELAERGPDGGWRLRTVAEERGGFDGTDVALELDRDGLPVIAYQASFPDPVTQETIRELRLARGVIR